MDAEWGLAWLFVVCFLAATILPLSSEAVLLFFLLSDYSPVACFFVALAGNSLGGSTNVFLGRWGRKITGSRKRRLWGKERIERYGSWLALLSWVPFIGDPLLIALGFYRTPLIATLLLMVIGKAARYGTMWYAFSLA